MDTIIENLRKRKSEIKNGESSGIVTGLVVQGGAMRGLYSMSVLTALEEMGFSDSFDHVLGASAGAINGAYFLAEQSKMAVSIYLDDLSDKRFINFMRLKKVVDIDYMTDVVVKQVKLLNLEKVRNSFTTLHTVLTDFQTGDPFYVTNRDAEVDLFEMIRATAALPILYNKPVIVKNKKYVDGGISNAIPLFKARELGCTDIVVVLTREPTFRREAPGFFMWLLEEPFLRNISKELKKRIVTKDLFFNETMDFINSYNDTDPNLRILRIFPSDLNRLVSRTQNNRMKLLDCSLLGQNDARRAFGQDELKVNPFV